MIMGQHLNLLFIGKWQKFVSDKVIPKCGGFYTWSRTGQIEKMSGSQIAYLCSQSGRVEYFSHF